jgi:hypothetical protein
MKMPALAQDSMAVGMKWGGDLAQKAMAKLKAAKEKEEQEQP